MRLCFCPPPPSYYKGCFGECKGYRAPGRHSIIQKSQKINDFLNSFQGGEMSAQTNGNKDDGTQTILLASNQIRA